MKGEKRILDTDSVVEMELRGVTPDMLDWWWVNIEKGYPLWEPEGHKSCVWEVPPSRETHLGAIHVVEESMGDLPMMKIRIRWEDPDTCPVPIEYAHAVVAAGIIPPDDKVVGYVVHQYEARSYGTKIKSISRMLIPRPPDAGKNWIRHAKSELSRFSEFLPELYKLWQVVEDPDINRQCCLKQK